MIRSLSQSDFHASGVRFHDNGDMVVPWAAAPVVARSR
jgi:hypothetical protein